VTDAIVYGFMIVVALLGGALVAMSFIEQDPFQ
jgi:hypothetical protein